MFATLAPAVAHVTIAPTALPAESVGEITFRCPNERPNAATTQLVVQLPPQYPLALVKVRPVPGWRIATTARTLSKPMHTPHGDVTSAIDTITWEGGEIRPGEHQNFSIFAGPLPRGVAQLTFKALQTYSNGEIVRWIDVRRTGEPEPPHPAPVLRLVQHEHGAPRSALLYKNK
jgi:uncharacterized protein YcnI